jgi:hypothetical protein
MLIATFERNQATVVQVKVDVDTLLKSLADPEGVAESFGVTEDH